MKKFTGLNKKFISKIAKRSFLIQTTSSLLGLLITGGLLIFAEKQTLEIPSSLLKAAPLNAFSQEKQNQKQESDSAVAENRDKHNALREEGLADLKPVSTLILPDPFPNTPPTANSQKITVEKNRPARTDSVLVNVYDVEFDPISVQKFEQPKNGTVQLNQDGTFLYTPNKDFVGQDSFEFILSDGKQTVQNKEEQKKSVGTVFLNVIDPTGFWTTTHFTDLQELATAADRKNIKQTSPIDLEKRVMPRLVDWNKDGLLDILAGVQAKLLYFENIGTKTNPVFAEGVPVLADKEKIDFNNNGWLSVALADANNDGIDDLWLVPNDKKVRCALVEPAKKKGEIPTVSAPVLIKAVDGSDYQVADQRLDIADWNGDGIPDILIGSGSGSIQLALGKTANSSSVSASSDSDSFRFPVFDAPIKELDAQGTAINGSYNLNVRLTDLNQDGLNDLSVSFNWGTIHFRLNQGSADAADISRSGQFSLSAGKSTIVDPENKVDMYNITNGPVCDWGDLNGDGTIDLIFGGENNGKIRFARGESALNYVPKIREVVEKHPKDLGAWLAEEKNLDQKTQMQTLLGATFDYITQFATPSQKKRLGRQLTDLILDFPQYFKMQKLDLKEQPGIPSMAAQLWMNILMIGPDDPAIRKHLTKTIGATGGYKKLIEEIGLIYIENNENPDGANAIYDWVRFIPRSVYPGRGITAADWLGGKIYMPRGHLKNTFNGKPVDNGEYGFGPDARNIIGSRGTENWFMTVVKHEACHDIDAYVRKNPELNRRWGQMIVQAAGADVCANPETGWFDWNATKEHFQEKGLWDGKKETWKDAWEQYKELPENKERAGMSFMRGNSFWFLDAPQESLATQGNQFWNSTEGRIEVAIDRFDRGYKANISEVLFYLDIWSVGYDKIKFFETDNSCRQLVRFAQLRRNQFGYIDQIDLGNGLIYEFNVDKNGLVTDIIRRGN